MAFAADDAVGWPTPVPASAVQAALLSSLADTKMTKNMMKARTVAAAPTMKLRCVPLTAHLQ